MIASAFIVINIVHLLSRENEANRMYAYRKTLQKKSRYQIDTEIILLL